MNKASPPNHNKKQKGAPAVEGAMSAEAQDLVKNKSSSAAKALKIMFMIVVFLVFAVSAFLWYVFHGPQWGTMYYGVCKVFAERYVDFPTTMNIREVEYYGLNVRLFVSHLDASGQFNFNVVECEYGKGTLEITRVRVDRKVLSDTNEDNPIEKEILENFNKGLNAILMNPPSLLTPRSKRDAALADLWQGE